MKERVLIVDDETTNLKLLREILRDRYTLAFAKNGFEALRLAQKTLPDLLLLDIMMPDMDGYTVCRKLKENPVTQEVPVIIVSALSKELDEIEGLEAGAVDYITKPIRPAVVLARVQAHLALKKMQKELANQNIILEQRVAERTVELEQTQNEIVERLGFAAEYRDPETGNHTIRMSHYTEALARAYGLPERVCQLILQAAPMHDIGKVGIPDAVLLKSGKLEDQEWMIMRSHAEIGGKILSNSLSPLLLMAERIALCHHEKWDGTGYPNRIAGEEIPIEARMAAIADVFDALTTKRPYKEPWPIEKAVNLIREEAGRHFDPELSELFVKILPEILEIRERHS